MHDIGRPTDERLAAGILHQRRLLRELEAAGTKVIGWKAGLGAPASRASLGLAAPLIGLLPDATRHPTGTPVPISSWVRPLIEAEVAVRMGPDVPSDAAEMAVLSAVASIAPAIELVDLARPPEDPAAVLSGNIYHRAWLTGPFVPIDGPLDLGARLMTILPQGEDPITVDRLEALTGPVGAVLAETARMAGRIGPGLRSGDIVLLGSVVAPRAVAPGDAFRVALGSAEVEVSLR